LPGNRNRHSVNIVEYFVIRKPDHLPAARFEVALPRPILLFRFFVVAAIDFDTQILSGAGEVSEEWSDWVLPPKLQVAEPFCSKSLPEERFGFRRFLTEVPGSFNLL